MIMILSVVVPVLLLGTLAIIVPRVFEALLPESVTGIALTGLLSTVVLWLLASAAFALLYAIEDARVLKLLADVPSAGVGHFLQLGINAALIWGPVLVLVLTTAPRRWKTSVW